MEGALAKLGRKLLPLENPITGRERFAWLVRALRAFHDNPEVRETEKFSFSLDRFLEESLKPATLNRLENGDLDFSVERCIAYEKALGLEQDLLLSVYVYVLRRDGQAPRGRRLKIREVDAADLELIYRLGCGEPIKAVEWLDLSFLYRSRSDLFAHSVRLRGALFEGVLRDLASTYEKDQRLMREALINIGDELAPLIVECATEDSVRYFTAVEALGHMDGPKSWEGLIALREYVQDSWAAQSILESAGRRVRGFGQSSRPDSDSMKYLFQHSVKILGDPEELFYAREAAADFIRTPGFVITAKQRAFLDAYRQDLRQLMVTPSDFRAEDVVSDILRRFEVALKATRDTGEIPLRVPGLNKILHNGIFASNREERMVLATLLSAWNLSPLIAKAAGEVLIEIPNNEYGTSRSMVRFLTKIRSDEMYPYFNQLLQEPNLEENIRLCLAWALGLGNDPNDVDSLAKIYRSTRNHATKRALSTAAFRRGAQGLLTEISHDANSSVSRGAILALSDLLRDQEGM